MDDELRKYLDGMMAQINGQFERVLNRLTAVERDFQNTKNFLVGRRPGFRRALARP